MKKLSEKSRKILRKVYMLFGATAISMLFAACYGMPMDCWEDCEYPCCNREKNHTDGNGTEPNE
jgi:hypothetical protein